MILLFVLDPVALARRIFTNIAVLWPGMSFLGLTPTSGLTLLTSFNSCLYPLLYFREVCLLQTFIIIMCYNIFRINCCNLCVGIYLLKQLKCAGIDRTSLIQ